MEVKSELHIHTYVCVCAAISEVKDYQRDFLLPVTAQPSHHASVVASILEQHTAELSAAQEWDNEWNSQGLLTRLTPQVTFNTTLVTAQCEFTASAPSVQQQHATRSVFCR